MDYLPGTPCTVLNARDLFMDYDARKFIDKPCVIIKKTKGGLYQVALADNPKMLYSVPKSNIELCSKSGS